MMKISYCLAVFVCGAATSASTVTFHVNPSAAPGGDGSPSKPFTTLVEARDSVRAARQAGKIVSSKAVEIVLAPGDYVQTEGFVLEPCDGGASESAPVVWRAAKTDTARIVGGVRVPMRAFSPVTNASVLARLPEEARGKVLQADLSAILPGKVPSMAAAFGDTPTAPLLPERDSRP